MALLTRQIARFLITGVANTAVGMGVIFTLKALLAVNDVAANAVGYVVGLCFSFLVNSTWTFEHRGSMLPAALRFLSVFLVAYTVNLGVMLLLRDRWAVNSYLAHVLAAPFYTAIFFVGSKWFAFRTSGVLHDDSLARE